MYKLIITVVLTAITVVFGYKAVETVSIKKDTNFSSVVLGDTTSTDPTSSPPIASDENGWAKLKNDKLGIELRYPKIVEVKTISDESVLIKGLDTNRIDILINREKLLANETVNTIAEKDIDEKQKHLDRNFQLLETITPIAIADVTGITYKLLEDGVENAYVYIPLKENYILKVKNSILGDSSLRQTTEKIIFTITTVR